MKKILIVVVALLLGIVGGYMAFGKGGEEPEKPKVAGSLHQLSPEFLLNLSDGATAKLSVSLVLDPDDEHALASADDSGHGASKQSPHPQEPLIRQIVTDVVSEATSRNLRSSSGRKAVAQTIQKQIVKTTDAHVDRVSITDIIVD